VTDRGRAIGSDSGIDWTEGGVFMQSSGLTFDLSGLPKAGPLEGMVSPLVEVRASIGSCLPQRRIG
jgi:hypothetical protein